MRLRACLALIVLATSACAYVPDSLRFELGGSTLEFKKKPVEAPPVPEPEPEPESGPEELEAVANDVQPS